MTGRRRRQSRPQAGGHDQQQQATLTIDALGRKCPIPIIMLADGIHEVPVGSVVAVLADDPAARTDIPAWCRMKTHEFITEGTLQRGWSFLVRRRY